MPRIKGNRGSGELIDKVNQTLKSGIDSIGKGDLEDIDINSIELDSEQPRTIGISIDEIKTIRQQMVDFKNDDQITLVEPDEFDQILDKDKLHSTQIKKLEKIYELAQSIQNTGLIHFPLVYRKGITKILIAGERRTLAHFLLGETIIKCFVYPNKPEEFVLKSIQLIENLNREDLTPIEILEAIEKINKLHKESKGSDISGREIARSGILTKTQANKYLRIIKLPVIREELANHKLSLNLAFKASDLVINEKLSERQAIKKVLESPEDIVSLGKTNTKVLSIILEQFDKKLDRGLDLKKPEDIRKGWKQLLSILDQ